MNTVKRQRGRPKSQFHESSAGTLQSLDRALGVLTAIAQADGATLTDISQSLQIPTATTHRILMTLQKHGFARLEEEQQLWLVGIEAYRTGAAYLRRASLTDIGRPVMRHLMETTGETANMAIPEGGDVVFVAQVESHNPVRAFFPPGARSSMYASGTGKAILSQMPVEAVRRLYSNQGLTPFTENTHMSEASLLEDLEVTKNRGWSFDREERYSGMSCIGSVIYDENGEVCAGVSISGPSSRFSAERIEVLGSAVARAAAEITRLSGGRLPAPEGQNIA